MAKPTRHGDKWRIRWFDAAGTRQSAVYAEFKTAELELGRRLIEAEEIRTGQRDPDPGRRTFDELCDYWLAKRAPRKRSRKAVADAARRDIRPVANSSQDFWRVRADMFFDTFDRYYAHKRAGTTMTL